MSSLFGPRGFNPLAGGNIFGQSLFGNGRPTGERADFWGLAGSNAFDSDPAKANVWAGLTQAYRGGGAPSSFNKWLSFQQPEANSAYMLAREKDPSIDFAGFSGNRDFYNAWEMADPTEAGRSNFYNRYRVQGG
jgi:hypothetical protein